MLRLLTACDVEFSNVISTVIAEVEVLRRLRSMMAESAHTVRSC